jgi:hypothetical protein
VEKRRIPARKCGTSTERTRDKFRVLFQTPPPSLWLPESPLEVFASIVRKFPFESESLVAIHDNPFLAFT